MGNVWQRLLSKFNDRDVRVLMCGLDAAGKTTTLYQLKLGEVVTTIPTIGFNVETVNYKNINFTTWDVSGRSGTRALLRHYYQGTDVILFVIDSNDRDRIKECKQDIERFLGEDELASSVFLVMANKQDLPNALSVEEITEILELQTLLKDRTWHIQGTCATTGEGLYEGLNWIHSVLTKKEIKKAVMKPVKEMLPDSDDTKGKKEELSWWNSLKRYLVPST